MWLVVWQNPVIKFNIRSWMVYIAKQNWGSIENNVLTKCLWTTIVEVVKCRAGSWARLLRHLPKVPEPCNAPNFFTWCIFVLNLKLRPSYFFFFFFLSNYYFEYIHILSTNLYRNRFKSHATQTYIINKI